MENTNAKNTLDSARKTAIDLKDAAVDTFHSGVEKSAETMNDLKTEFKNGASRVADHMNSSSINTEFSGGLKRITGEMNQMKTEISSIASDVQKDLSEKAHSVGKSVKSNPYAYIAGAFGVGLVAAASLLTMRKSKYKHV